MDAIAATTSGLRAAREASKPAPAWTRWAIPTLPDIFFIALMLWLFGVGPVGWGSLLIDGDTGWHVRTGEWILANGRVPTTDLYSFSKPGAPWFAWEWGSDVVFALIHNAWGPKGLVYFAGILIVSSIVILLRWMAWRGSLFLIALPLALMCVGVSSIHYLARPHVFTMLFLPIALWIVDADRKQPSTRLWLLIPLTAVWTNVHGGFMAWIACTGLLFGGYLVEAALAWWRRESAIDLPSIRRYGLLLAGCSAATLINPYGYHLHEHIAKYLRSDFIHEVVQEFQSPSFRGEIMLQLEVLLFLGLIAAGIALTSKRPDWVAILWLAFWAHQCLQAVRHATVYVLVGTPLIAAVLSEKIRLFTDELPKASVARILTSLAEDVAARFRGLTPWPIAFLIVYGFLGAPLVRWPSDFPELKFPLELMHRHKAFLASHRVLTSDQWADYLIYQSYPQQRVFVDGRSDFYGAEVGREYLLLMTGQDGWEKVVDKYGFEAALVPGDWTLVPQLRKSREWKLIGEDRKVKSRGAYLFVRERPTQVAQR